MTTKETTKEKVLDAFRSDLGQQLDLLYVTEDDRIFIRPLDRRRVSRIR